jgi:hypothetical protein
MMSGQPAASGANAPRVLLVDAGQLHDVFEVLEVTDGTARVRTPFLFELGEELKLRVEDAGGAFEVVARVVAHIGGGEDKITELELFERTPV